MYSETCRFLTDSNQWLTKIVPCAGTIVPCAGTPQHSDALGLDTKIPLLFLILFTNFSVQSGFGFTNYYSQSAYMATYLILILGGYCHQS